MRIVTILLLTTAVTASASAKDGTSNSPARLRGADRRGLQRQRRPAHKQDEEDDEDQSDVQVRIDKRMERRNYNQGKSNSLDETSEDDNDRWERRNYNNGRR